MRTPRTPSGLKPFTKAERRRIASDNARSLFPDIIRQRFEATCRELEAKGVHAVEQRVYEDRGTP